jgi:hypothetical protein
MINRKKYLKYLATFMIFITLCTVISRVITTAAAPNVTVEKPKANNVTHSISSTGTIEKNSEEGVYTLAGQLIKKMYVNIGEKVEIGDVIFELDADRLQDMIFEKNIELEKMNLQKMQEESRLSTSKADKERAKRHAEENYNQTIINSDADILKARVELDNAKSKLEEEKMNQNSSNLSSLEIEVENKENALDEAEKRKLDIEITYADNALTEAQKQLKEARDLGLTEDELQPFKDTVDIKNKSVMDLKYNRYIYDKQAELASAKAKLEEGKANNVDKEELKILEENIRLKETLLEDTIRQKERNLLSAVQAVENAEAETVKDISIRTLELDIAVKENEIAMLKVLENDECKITAPISGIITSINVGTGSLTSNTAVALIADSSLGYRFVSNIATDDVKYLSVNMEVLLTSISNNENISGCVIESIRTLESNSSLTEIVVLVPAKNCNIGESFKMDTIDRSSNYPVCVPISAVFEEDNSYFVYVLEEEASVLGIVNIAKRQTVAIVDKNEQYAAISENSLSNSQNVIIDSDRIIQNGASVRIKD